MYGATKKNTLDLIVWINNVQYALFLLHTCTVTVKSDTMFHP